MEECLCRSVFDVTANAKLNPKVCPNVTKKEWAWAGRQRWFTLSVFFPAQLCSLLNILLQTGGNFSQRKILLVEKYWVQADRGGCEGRPLFCVKEGTPADKSVWDSVCKGGCTFLELNHHLTVWHMWLFSCLQSGTKVSGVNSLLGSH